MHLNDQSLVFLVTLNIKSVYSESVFHNIAWVQQNSTRYV